VTDAPPEPLLRFASVTRHYPGTDRPALSDVSFDVMAGQTTVLLGPSGCGKTSLLKLAAALDAPDAGQVLCPGERPAIGYVFQTPTLLPWATVAANVALPGRLRRTPDAGQVARALADVGLADRAGSLPHTLSGGMQMRVSIARALASDARLLLLDEPFAALDEISRARLQDLLLDLRARRGMTLLSVTHSIAEAVTLADRVVVMAAQPGRVHARLPIERHGADGGWRSSPAFAAHAARLMALLAEAATDAG